MKIDKRLFRKNGRGFTLVEILIAVLILSIGILAVSQLTIMGMRSHSNTRVKVYARTTMDTFFETLKGLPGNHAWLSNPDGVTPDLADTVNFDQTTTVQNQLTDNMLYNIGWNIVDDIPDTRFVTIRIYVRSSTSRAWIWGDFIRPKT